MHALVLLLLTQTPLVATTGYVDSRTTGAWTQLDGAPGRHTALTAMSDSPIARE